MFFSSASYAGLSAAGESFILTPAASSVDEGAALGFTLTTTGIASGTTLYWTINNATTAAGDFSASSGSFTVTGGTGTFSVTAIADATTESAETFTVSIRKTSISGLVVVTSTSITVNDTSLTPVVTFTSTPASVNEGSAAPFSITVTNFATGTLYWTINHITTAAADFSAVSGTIAVSANAGSISVPTVADSSTEGAQTFTVSVRKDSIAGTVIGTSASVTINDTSLSPTGQVLHVGSASVLNGSDSGTQLAWVVPTGVTSISVLCIAGGGGGAYVNASTNGGGSAGGGGGGLAYTNNISVTPGETITLRAGNGGGTGANGIVRAPTGGNSQIYRPATPTTYLVRAYGGAGGIRTTTASTTIVGGAGGSYGVGQAGFTGGNGGGGLNGNNSISATVNHGGGGGAAGYTGNGGTGGGYNGNYVTATAGLGGGGGGGGDKTCTGGTVSAPSSTNNFPGQGGGVGPFGIGTSGSAGASSGSGVAGNATNGGSGSGAYNYGGGGAAIATPSGSTNGSPGQAGCIRVIWPGTTRQFPSTGTADQ